jgi:DNA-directed RNA polymerase specialized sigma24 family protein
MSDLHTLGLIDSEGQPFEGRITKVLHQIAPRLRREFPALEDEVVVTEVLEEAGRRIVQREAKRGSLERLYGFAWVTIQNVARSRLRTRKAQIARLEARGDEFTVPLVAQEGSPEQIERDLLLKELLSNLSTEEQEVILYKKLGLSTAEIAARQQRSPGAVDVLFFRIKQKFRDLLSSNDASGTATAASPATRTASASSRRPAPCPEATDAPARSLPGRRRGW